MKKKTWITLLVLAAVLVFLLLWLPVSGKKLLKYGEIEKILVARPLMVSYDKVEQTNWEIPAKDCGAIREQLSKTLFLRNPFAARYANEAPKAQYLILISFKDGGHVTIYSGLNKNIQVIAVRDGKETDYGSLKTFGSWLEDLYKLLEP